MLELSPAVVNTIPESQFDALIAEFFENRFCGLLNKIKNSLSKAKSMPTCYIVYARETGIEPQVKLLANYLLTIGMDVICEAIFEAKSYHHQNLIQQIHKVDYVIIMGTKALQQQCQQLDNLIMGGEISSMPLAAREVTVIRQRIQNNKQHTLWMVPVRFDGTTEQCLPALLDKVNVIDATSAWPNYTAILHLMQRLLPHQQNLFGDIVSKWRQAQEVQSWQKNADRADELRRYVYAFYTYKKQQNEQRDEFIRRQLKKFLEGLTGQTIEQSNLNTTQTQIPPVEKSTNTSSMLDVLSKKQIENLSQKPSVVAVISQFPVIDNAVPEVTMVAKVPRVQLLDLDQMLRNFYQKFDQLPLLLYERSLPIEQSFINLSILENIYEKTPSINKTNNNENNLEQTKVLSQANVTTFEEIYSVRKESIKLENIFKPINGKLPQKLLIEGKAGIGKSTLFRQIIDQWTKRRLFNEFDIVFWIPLRKLRNYTPAMLTLAEVIQRECLGMTEDAAFNHQAISQWLEMHRGKILWGFDGFDEVADVDPNSPLGKFLQELYNQTPHIITSRPNFYNYTQEDRRLEIVGFTDQDCLAYVTNFCQQVGAADHAKALQALLQQQVHLRNMARIPIILELICSSFIEQKNWVYGSDMGLTNVYRAIITSLLKRYLLRQGEAIEELSSKAVWEHPRCQLLLQALAAIAWQGMQQHDLIIGPKGYFFVLKQMRIDQDAEMLQEIFVHFGILQRASVYQESLLNQEYCFSHLSIQEFFAAIYLENCLKAPLESTKYKQARSAILYHKYEPRWQLIMSFTAGLLRQNQDLFAKYWQLIANDARDTVGLYALFLEIRCLEEGNPPEPILVKWLPKLQEGIRALFLTSNQTTTKDVLINYLVISPNITRNSHFKDFADHCLKQLKEMPNSDLKLLLFCNFILALPVYSELFIRAGVESSNLPFRVKSSSADKGAYAQEAIETFMLTCSSIDQKLVKELFVDKRSGLISGIYLSMGSDWETYNNQMFAFLRQGGTKDKIDNNYQNVVQSFNNYAKTHPEKAKKIIETDIESCKTDKKIFKVGYEHYSADLRMISVLAQGAPQYADLTMPILIDGIKNSYVPDEIYAAILTILQLQPNYIQDVQQLLQSEIKYGQNLARIVGILLQVAPTQADALFTLLMQNYQNYINKDQIEVADFVKIFSIVVCLCPQHAKRVYDWLCKLPVKSAYERQSIYLAFAVAVQADPTIAEGILVKLIEILPYHPSSKDTYRGLFVDQKNIGTNDALSLQIRNMMTVLGFDEFYHSAFFALAALVKVAPQHLPKIIPVLEAGIEHKKSKVRYDTCLTLGVLFKADPRTVEKFVPLLLRVCEDKSREVMLKAHELFNMSLQLASQFAITAVPQFIKAMRNKENELSTNRGGLEIVDYFEVFTLKNLPVMLGDRGSRLLLKTGTKETGFDSDVILFLWLMTHSKILKNSTIHLLSLNEEVGRLYTQEESQPVSIELSMELALTVSFIIQKLSQKILEKITPEVYIHLFDGGFVYEAYKTEFSNFRSQYNPEAVDLTHFDAIVEPALASSSPQQANTSSPARYIATVLSYQPSPVHARPNGIQSQLISSSAELVTTLKEWQLKAGICVSKKTLVVTLDAEQMTDIDQAQQWLMSFASMIKKIMPNAIKQEGIETTSDELFHTLKIKLRSPSHAIKLYDLLQATELFAVSSSELEARF